MELKHISKEEFDRIGRDYKSVYMDYDGTHPQRKGRRTSFLPGYGTTLFIEGIHFLVDDDYGHLPVLCKDNAEVGAWYRGGIVVQELYSITPEYAADNDMMYLDRVVTSIGDYALPGSAVIK